MSVFELRSEFDGGLWWIRDLNVEGNYRSQAVDDMIVKSKIAICRCGNDRLYRTRKLDNTSCVLEISNSKARGNPVISKGLSKTSDILCCSAASHTATYPIVKVYTWGSAELGRPRPSKISYSRFRSNRTPRYSIWAACVRNSHLLTGTYIIHFTWV